MRIFKCFVVSAADDVTLQIQRTFPLWYLPHLSNDEGKYTQCYSINYIETHQHSSTAT